MLVLCRMSPPHQLLPYLVHRRLPPALLPLLLPPRWEENQEITALMASTVWGCTGES